MVLLACSSCWHALSIVLSSACPTVYTPGSLAGAGTGLVSQTDIMQVYCSEAGKKLQQHRRVMQLSVLWKV